MLNDYYSVCRVAGCEISWKSVTMTRLSLFYGAPSLSRWTKREDIQNIAVVRDQRTDMFKKMLPKSKGVICIDSICVCGSLVWTILTPIRMFDVTLNSAVTGLAVPTKSQERKLIHLLAITFQIVCAFIFVIQTPKNRWRLRLGHLLEAKGEVFQLCKLKKSWQSCLELFQLVTDRPQFLVLFTLIDAAIWMSSPNRMFNYQFLHVSGKNDIQYAHYKGL